MGAEVGRTVPGRGGIQTETRHEGDAMKHAHDDILVHGLRLAFIVGPNGWLMPWGDVICNPLKAQRLAEEYLNRQEAA